MYIFMYIYISMYVCKLKQHIVKSSKNSPTNAVQFSVFRNVIVKFIVVII